MISEILSRIPDGALVGAACAWIAIELRALRRSVTSLHDRAEAAERRLSAVEQHARWAA